MYMVCILKFSSAESDDSIDEPQDGGDDEHDNCDSRPDNSVSLPVAVKSGDLACIVNLKEQRPLTDQEKLYVLDHSFMPHSRYNFTCRTINGCKRHFQSKWLSSYNGLVYSESTNGGYCKYCVLFARYSPKLTELGVFVSKPFTNFKKATEKLNQHFFEKQFHKSAVETALMFHKVQYNQMPPVDKQRSTLQKERIAQNRLKLCSIVETIIFCGRQGIALRGHRDDQTHLDSHPLSNHGNYLALLKFRVQAGDKTHLETAPANAMYTSKTIQNELICICGNFIQNKILESIREAGFYSVRADEATDASNHEQLSITIRFVSNDCPCERFLGFHKCETGVTGEAIAENILSQLRLWQLPVSLLRGQSYDGAGAMSAQIRGAASRISSKYPKAVYVHCAANRLNLCIVKCCKIRVVSNLIDTVSSVARFFNNSPKRQLALEKWIADVQPCDEKRRKLKYLCRTRWIERHEAYEVFIDLFFPLVSCVEDIVHSSSSEWNRDTRSDAHSCLLALSQFSFICTLVVTKTILACTKGLSVKLQGRYIDVVRAHKDIEAVKSTLKEFRSDVESFHDRHYHEAFQLAALVDVEESAPHLAGRQQHRQNVPATSTAEYYRLNVTVPLLDHIISELDSRFNSESSSVVVEFSQLLPCALYQKPASEWLTAADLDRVLKLYEGDLPCARSMDVELGLWRAMWKDSELAEDLNTPVKALPHVDKDYFPNIRTLILIMVTIPITSCECERSFSLLRLVKSTLRTTMTEDRLNGLALMQCHQDIKLDPNEIVEEFARYHPRRMKL